MPADSLMNSDVKYLRQTLRLAWRGEGRTSPNPMVGAVLVKNGKIIGQGWHHQAGKPHAEIEALRDAERKGHTASGATLYVSLEPCSTHGRTPPCTDAVIAAGVKRIVIAAQDPNPAHAGRGLKILRRAGLKVTAGLLAEEATDLNEAFNHWIVHRTPFVTVKAAMSLDGKIATVTGESKWITGEKARAYGMKLRTRADAILVGVNTVVKDNPRLTIRDLKFKGKRLRRIILDPTARTPLKSHVIADDHFGLTTVVATKAAPIKRLIALREHVNVVVTPTLQGKINLRWLLKKLGHENVTNLLVEGGGETNASFLLAGLAQRIAFFYAPVIIGGRTAPKGVAGDGIAKLADKIELDDANWTRLGPDLLLTARILKSRINRR